MHYSAQESLHSLLQAVEGHFKDKSCLLLTHCYLRLGPESERPLSSGKQVHSLAVCVHDWEVNRRQPEVG